MKKRIIVIIILLLLLIPAILILADKIRQYYTITTSYAASEYPETNAYLDNPYCGFYHIYGYVLKDETVYASVEDVPFIPNPETTQTEEQLVQIQINLCRFADEPIPELALEQLNLILDAWSRTEYSILLRFFYDWDGYAMEAEPDSIELIMQHMEQVANVYNQYADSIFMVQGLSTGNTGEMHNTNYGDKEDLKTLGDQLVRVSDPSIFLSVRTPHQWRCVTGVESYEELEALTDSPYLGRLGLFNDGMFGSESDTGTYMTRSREEELQFQNVLCNTVPNGGEAIIDNPFNDLENAIRDMRTMHVSYLNSVHDASVMTKWQTCTYDGNDVFHGLSGFEYIRRHLGYRYIIRSTELTTDPDSQTADLSLSIENTGFSISYRTFSFLLTLVNTETGETFSITPEETSTCLQSSETTTLTIFLDIPSYLSGTYELYWQTTDNTSGKIIRYGNDMPLTKYGYSLGTLTIDNPRKPASEN